MDNPQEIAFDLEAPADERTDALASLHKDYAPTSSDLHQQSQLKEIVDRVQEELLAKAIDPANAPFPSSASKEGADGMQSVYYDDFRLSSRGDYWERPSALSFDFLRGMVANTPVLNAVVMTRTRQVQRFARVCEKDTSLPGFQITHVDRKHSPSKSELEKMAELNKFISNCGFEFSARRRKALHRDSFAQFLGKATRDSLMLDSFGIETEMKNNKALGMDGFYLVDGGTIRLCSERGYNGNPDIHAVQVVGGMVRTAYGYEDLIYEPRNPRSDVLCGGYGLPETELLIRVVTGFLNAMTMNNNVFDNNSIPKGVLHLFGNFGDQDLSAFRRYWANMVRGVGNSLNLPVLVSKDAESAVKFEKFGVDFNEMMFAKWMTFLTSIICAVYGMSPSEINFDSFTGGNTSALGGNDTAEKLAASKDSGLRPLLAYFENVITDYIVSDFNSDFCFRFTGLDIEDQAQRLDLRKTLLTVDELRAEEGYGKSDNGLGGAPVNPALLNAWMQLQGQRDEQQAPPEDDNKQRGDKPGQDELEQEPDNKEGLQKAHGHGGDDDIFAPHPNLFVRPIIEDYTQSSMIRVSEIRQALSSWLQGDHYSPGAQEEPPLALAYSPSWTEDEAAQVELYLMGRNPAAYSINELTLLCKSLVRRYLPTDVLVDELINEMAHGYIMGAAQATWQASNPGQEPTAAQVSAITNILPNTLESVLTALKLSAQARASLDYGAAMAAENIVQLTDDVRGKIQGALANHAMQRAAGDQSATTGKLQQTLLDKFGEMNRDWRRIAITEINNMKMAGFIASQAPGEKVKRLERYDACPFCKKINGMVFTVVDPGKPDKDGATEVWTGKTNMGRSGSPNKRTEEGLSPRVEAELWWVPEGVVHPHCRGDFVPYVAPDGGQ